MKSEFFRFWTIFGILQLDFFILTEVSHNNFVPFFSMPLLTHITILIVDNVCFEDDPLVIITENIL